MNKRSSERNLRGQHPGRRSRFLRQALRHFHAGKVGLIASDAGYLQTAGVVTQNARAAWLSGDVATTTMVPHSVAPAFVDRRGPGTHGDSMLESDHRVGHVPAERMLVRALVLLLAIAIVGTPTLSAEKPRTAPPIQPTNVVIIMPDGAHSGALL